MKIQNSKIRNIIVLIRYKFMICLNGQFIAYILLQLNCSQELQLNLYIQIQIETTYPVCFDRL